MNPAKLARLSEWQDRINAASALQGKWVRFAHQVDEGPSYKVVRMDGEGMIELDGMSGLFAPHLFLTVEERERV